jgi:hypothetical protein
MVSLSQRETTYFSPLCTRKQNRLKLSKLQVFEHKYQPHQIPFPVLEYKIDNIH